LCGLQQLPDDPLAYQDAKRVAKELYERWQQPVFLTRREYGCTVYDHTGFHNIPGLRITAQTDTVGAGDSMLAGIAAAMAAGKDAVTAAEFGNLVAGVTVQKLFQTGTASPEEILAVDRHLG
jgi:sugar/nucleoside kinase (ribokinase family)